MWSVRWKDRVFSWANRATCNEWHARHARRRVCLGPFRCVVHDTLFQGVVNACVLTEMGSLACIFVLMRSHHVAVAHPYPVSFVTRKNWLGSLISRRRR
ncbi:KR domain-containing protein [Sesbania bispinosa]|nr:KR domain-containing protein [Sesbania bispinosa]